jgi:FLYWCH zinc finger domain
MATVSVGSIRGRRKLALDGYQYVFDRKSSDGSRNFWRCELKMSGCPVRIHTDTLDNVTKRM